MHEAETVSPLAMDTVYSTLLVAHEHCRPLRALRAAGETALLAKDSTRAAPERETSVSGSIKGSSTLNDRRTDDADTGDTWENQRHWYHSIGNNVSQSNSNHAYARNFTQAEAGTSCSKTVQSAGSLARCNDNHCLHNQCYCLLVLLPAARDIALYRCCVAHENLQRRF